jgi:hypothetical protein
MKMGPDKILNSSECRTYLNLEERLSIEVLFLQEWRKRSILKKA